MQYCQLSSPKTKTKTKPKHIHTHDQGYYLVYIDNVVFVLPLILHHEDTNLYLPVIIQKRAARRGISQYITTNWFLLLRETTPEYLLVYTPRRLPCKAIGSLRPPADNQVDDLKGGMIIALFGRPGVGIRLPRISGWSPLVHTYQITSSLCSSAAALRFWEKTRAK